MSDLTTVRATWGFLQTLHPLFLFAESLPTVDGAEAHFDAEQAATPATSDDVEHLKNEITRLRSGLKLNIIKTQLVDIYELSEDDPTEGLDDLEAELQIVLEELEQIVDSNVLELENESCIKPEGPAALAAFPKLVALRARLRESEDIGSNEVSSKLQLDDATDLASMQAISSWSQRYSAASIAQVASLIKYPQDASHIETFRKTVNRFGKALDRVLGDMAGFWKMEAQALDYTPHDVETIDSAHTFATVSTSLFGHMTEGCKRCEMPHQAKLHLSGFKEDSLRFNISTCEESSWVSAVFTCSPKELFLEPTPFENLCRPMDNQVEQAQLEVQQVMFNSTGMWCLQKKVKIEQHQPQQTTAEHALDQILADRDRLTPKYRKLAEVLLAACIFQLNESPWTEQYLRPDFLYVPPLDKKRLHQWCPRLLCDLVPLGTVGQQSDNIAAFGVLVLELEAHRRAAWTSEDEDWLSGAPSNSIRLARVLKDWEESVSDEYRRIAKACLDFESLTQRLDHPEIASEKKSLAVIYKCILEPLFRHMTTTFEDLTPLFKGMFGPSRGLTAAMDITAEGTAKRSLFDDDEGATKRDDQISAAKFMSDLRPFFKRIKDLYPTSSRIHFPIHEKVRIAVLDSGVNEEDDTMIWQAIKTGRISSKSKSFVGRPGDWMRDTYGHGTHVTRLLLESAPAAEIYVAKICTGKAINNEAMPGIAAAINWAVDEVDAHIISMSFGFDDEHDEIDAALDDALDAGKLIIAAASNNGGLSGRARPAHQDGVICMHATDGKGNKGGMNPSPLSKDDNFATLGVAVPSKWNGETVWKSGTSFAVPIAVGFAAGVLELARYRATLKPRKLKLLHKKQGMGAVLKRMAEERDGYDFVHPGRLARDWGDEKAVMEAAKTIEKVLGEL